MAIRPLVVIPARMESVRFPGKPLALISGEPMIVHVWRRALEADVGPVLVACGEREILEVISDLGGEAVLTEKDLPSGSDRVFAALCAYDSAGMYDIIVNLQGDLPLISPETIGRVLDPLEDSSVDIGTLGSIMGTKEDISSPHVVKAVVSLAPGARVGRALYFSRLPVPWGQGGRIHHIGIYAWRRLSLSRFVSLSPGILETREKLEQLRALEAGMRIDLSLVEDIPLGVDTPEDLLVIQSMMDSRK